MKLRCCCASFVLAVILFPAPGYATSKVIGAELSITDIYNHLTTVGGGIYRKYDNITYAKPTLNDFKNNDWMIQTPDMWGQSLDAYNKSFATTAGNHLNKEFLISTCSSDADCQGDSTCQSPDFTTDQNGKTRKLCITPAYKILSHIYDAIISAKRSVDITTLQPTKLRDSSFTTGAFTATIQHALLVLAQKSMTSSHPIEVRLLQGAYLPYTLTGQNEEQIQKYNQALLLSQKKYLENIVAVLPPKNKLVISVGSMRSCELSSNCGNEDKQHDAILGFAFNHGKIVDVDNSTLITGGHNLWGDDYLQKNPANDLSIEINGPVAQGATTYANTLWKYLCANPGVFSNSYATYDGTGGGISQQICPQSINARSISALPKSADTFTVMAMPIAKLNNGVGVGYNADQSEIARVFAFQRAQHTIEITQQAVFYKGIDDPLKRPILHPLYTIDGTVMQALAQAIMRGVNVYIVTSNINAKGYLSYVNLAYVHDYILKLLKNSGVASGGAQKVLSSYLHLAYISYANGTGGDGIRSHNKIWIVDNKVFYIGSHNIYPSSLQQYGVIIDSAEAAALLNKNLFYPMWKNAKLYIPTN